MVRRYPKAFTLKWNSSFDNYEDLEVLYSYYLNTLKQKYNVTIDYLVEEFDTNNVLHLHGVVNVPYGFRYDDPPMPGFSTKYKRLADPDIWLSYCRGVKGPDKQNNILYNRSLDVPFGQGHYRDFKSLKPSRDRDYLVRSIMENYHIRQLNKVMDFNTKPLI